MGNQSINRGSVGGGQIEEDVNDIDPDPELGTVGASDLGRASGLRRFPTRG